MERIIVVILLCISMTGCSTISYLVDPPPRVEDLYYTEDDVLEMIEVLTSAESESTGAVVYNPETDRYELTPEAMKRAVRDGIVKRLQDERIEEFVSEYEPETFSGAARKDMGTISLVLSIIFLAISLSGI